MEKFLEQSLEENEIGFKDFQGKEVEFLSKFKGPLSRKAASVMLFLSSITGQAALSIDAYAEGHGGSMFETETAQANTKNYEINKNEITSSSIWAEEILNKAKSEISEVKTNEDAEWFTKSNIMAFTTEFFLPTKGKIKKGAYDLDVRQYSQEDYELISNCANEMRDLLNQIKGQISPEFYSKLSSELERILIKTDRELSYAGQKQREVLDRNWQYER